MAPKRHKICVLYVEKSTSRLGLKCANTLREQRKLIVVKPAWSPHHFTPLQYEFWTTNTVEGTLIANKHYLSLSSRSIVLHVYQLGHQQQQGSLQIAGAPETMAYQQ
jgi:hypothetical protein